MTWRTWYRTKDRELRNEQSRVRLEEGVGAAMSLLALVGSVTIATHISQWSDNVFIQIVAFIVGAFPLAGGAIIVSNAMDRVGYLGTLQVEIASLVSAAGPDNDVRWTTELYDKIEDLAQRSARKQSGVGNKIDRGHG